MDVQAYIQGNRSAWVAMLQRCLSEIGIENSLAGQARWVLEREQTIAARLVVNLVQNRILK